MNCPEIDDAERFGSLWKFPKPKYIGRCAFSSCKNKDIYNDFEYFKDDFGHVFCSREHADLFYGLKSID